MSNSDSRVLTWLDSVPDDLLYARTRSAFQEQAYSRKRPHPDSPAPLSPPTSQRERARRIPLERKLVSKMLPMTPSNKRRKVGRQLMPGEDASPCDNDETPTQPNRGAASSLRDSETSSLSYQSSHASNNSSPSKMFSALGLYPSGVDRKQLDVDDPDVPVSLAELCIEMETIATGSRVVPKYLEPEISHLKTSARTFSLFRPGVFDPLVNATTSTETTPGVASDSLPAGHHKLTLDEIVQFVGDARDCHDMEQEEAGWNNLVHTPLLRAVFYGKSPRGRQLDGFCPCTSASILSGYRISSFHGKKVDYVFHLDPSKDSDQPAIENAALELRRTLTDNSINHTSYPPLRSHPLSVSIETKRSGESEQKAQLQMGVWQAAQWKLLSELAGDDLHKLPFIPGIFIHGHEWKFVATSHQNGKTVSNLLYLVVSLKDLQANSYVWTLWTGGTFGSTETPLKTFQAIAGVRRLRAWSLEVFWPWYKAYVLKAPTTSISAPSG
ncbi:hypothetical protein BHE90_017164 [Fusarium euwallaceae]|uniref:PD-(D/E)XK nuclease-like domain-containing protein n=2 Tax=Fusarium solani species complex TaxID=232080 RepID=A0A3M2R8G0_9HYPO|nr:hypothetical protein CDV36_015811 [Fusarium kuroshium]RTE68457.1 hypothetical protein BHE90_017164 [Fusarium euwallaceae]